MSRDTHIRDKQNCYVGTACTTPPPELCDSPFIETAVIYRFHFRAGDLDDAIVLQCFHKISLVKAEHSSGNLEYPYNTTDSI